MRRDERAAAIMRGEHRPGVEQQVNRRVVRRKRRDRFFKLRAASHLLPVAAVFGREHVIVRLAVPETIGPSKHRALVHFEHRLEWARGVLVRVELVREQRIERIAAVHRQIQMAVRPVEGDRLPQPAGVAIRRREYLAGHVRLEAPDAAVLLELRTRVLTQDGRAAIRVRARV